MKTSFIIILIFPLLVLAQETKKGDGNYWRQLDSNAKPIYITGFFNGVNFGKGVSYGRWLYDTAFVSKVNQSFQNFTDKYFKNVTYKRICNGLDSLYSDYKNIRITINDGIFLVLYSNSGASQGAYKGLLEDFRKSDKE